MRRERKPTAAELDLWRRVTRDVAPLSSEPARPDAAANASAAPQDAAAPERPARKAGKTPSSATAARRATRLDPGRPVDIDRRSWERLKAGQIAIQGRLDLHGRSQEDAHDALNRFLSAAVAAGLRCVLVVTGKGVDGHGVLRQMVPRWLGESPNRDSIITYSPAQPRHGGDGALYLLLRRRRARSDQG